MPRDPEKMVKARIAEAIVEEMLREAGYDVYRFGYESVLQNLTQSKEKYDRESEVGQSIKSMPDFVVVKERKPDFVEVKYRRDGKLGSGEFKKWREGRVILVFPFPPYFKTSRIKEFIEKNRLINLENDFFMKIDERILKKYGQIVVKYLKGK